MTRPKSNGDRISVVRAAEHDRPVVSNLVQLMLYDLSPIFGEWIGSDGRYVYQWLDAYWTEQARHPYLIYQGDQLSGFSLVMGHSPISGRKPCWFMAEYFVLRAQRRLGLGCDALCQILAKHRGRWEIAVMERNEIAVSFWAKALDGLRLRDRAKERRTHDGSNWIVHSFAR